MMQSIASRRKSLSVLVLMFFALLLSAGLRAQPAGSLLSGSILDVQGKGVAGAVVSVKNGANASRTTRTDAEGHYSMSDLSAGAYTLEVSASGFETKNGVGVVIVAGQTQQVTLTLKVRSVIDEVTVNASVDSIAVQTAPSGGFLEERSAQSLISNTYIRNFVAPTADYGEIVKIVPGTFTTSTDGVGLGQSKTYFRGFPDGDYDIDFDNIPFFDTNTPTHHSWAFFPSEWIGGVDFDRSPGTASTTGPTPFGGSIHLLSMPLSTEMDIRGTVSYGTWNTKIYDAAFNSGNFGILGSPKKSNLFVDVHRMTSDGYQTFNYNTRNAGSLLYQYQFSPRTVLTGFSGVLRVNTNTPNISSTRCMLYGASATGAYSCSYTLYGGTGNTTATTYNQPNTGAGIKFLMTDNSNPLSWFNYQYNSYQVPTDFEYVSLKSDFGKGWYLEVKPYTYNYDNGEKYSSASPMTDAAALNTTTIPGSIMAASKSGGTSALYWNGVQVRDCNVGVVKSGITALPCGIDKYNSYRKYGETSLLTHTSQLGVLRAGMWYEWAKTNRHQYPSDPLNNWADQPLPKFNERFWTNSYQPFAEYEFHLSKQLNVTAGTKYAAYTMDVLHFADDGATVGELSCYPNTTAACSATVSDHGSFGAWLPSLDANLRIQPNWSVYAQVGTGSIVPPSAVYDYYQTSTPANPNPQLTTPPKQQKSTTYQIGSVYKANKLTLDADAYHIRFQNSYSSVTDTTAGDVDLGDTVYFLQPSSVTQGVEFETNMVLAPGLSLYLNANADNAVYSGGSLNANTGTTALSAPVWIKTPAGLWVAQTPTDTESQGITYQAHGFDLGVFNMRVGEQHVDNGQYHNQAIVNPFSQLNTYFNYTVRNHSIFDQTKIRLSATNLLDSHNIQSLSLAGTATAATLAGTSCTTSAGATTACTDPFNATTAINGGDTPGIMAGRSFSVSVTFGFAPRER